MLKNFLFILMMNLSMCNPQNEFVLSGKIRNCEDGKVILSVLQDRLGYVPVDTVDILGGNFLFNSYKLDEPKIALLTYQSPSGKISGLINETIWIENKSIEVKGNFENREETEITGDEVNRVAKKYFDVWMPTRADKTSDDVGIVLTRSQINERYFQRIMEIVKENKDSYYMLEIIKNYAKLSNMYGDQNSEKRVNELLHLLNFTYQSYPVAQKIDAAQSVLHDTALGKKIPYFKNQDDKDKLFESTMINSKFTLIEFWSLGCKPCIEGFPYLAEIYRKYDKKGFNMIAVSLDKKYVSEWKTFLSKHDLPWRNIIESDKPAGKLSEMLLISYLPQNVLIDENQNIIDKNLNKKDLEEYLSKHLK